MRVSRQVHLAVSPILQDASAIAFDPRITSFGRIPRARPGPSKTREYAEFSNTQKSFNDAENWSKKARANPFEETHPIENNGSALFPTRH